MNYEKVDKFVFRFLELIALLFVIPSACVLILDLQDRQVQRAAQAWELLNLPAPGNSGKIQALEYLNSQDCVSKYWKPASWDERFGACGLAGFKWPQKERVYLQGIDLSEKTHGASVYLQGVKIPRAILPYANLSGAFLSDANLSGAYLLHANLSNVMLSCADLSKAKLSYVNLTSAYIGNGDLVNAKLINAEMSRSYLGSANLQSADLESANLTDAMLARANLSMANLAKATLSGADVSDAIFGKVPLRHVSTEKDLGKHPLFSNGPTGAYYFKNSEPTVSASLMQYFTLVPDGEACLWFHGLPFYECSWARPNSHAAEIDGTGCLSSKYFQ